MSTTAVTRIDEGTYRVDLDGRIDIVYVAGPIGDRWAFWNGEIFRAPDANSSAKKPGAPSDRDSGSDPSATMSALTAPMPASVLKVVVAPGVHVRKGDTLVILEAMKMELPLRAPRDATVKAVHCREGERVQPEAVLVELE